MTALAPSARATSPIFASRVRGWAERRCSPKRRPVDDLPCPPEILTELRRVIFAPAGSPAAQMHQVTLIRKVIDKMAAPPFRKAWMGAVLTETWEKSGEAWNLGYANMGASLERGRGWSIDQGRFWESLGFLRQEPTFHGPRKAMNGYNRMIPQIRKDWLDQAHALGPLNDNAELQPVDDGPDELVDDDDAYAEVEPAIFEPRPSWTPELNAIGELLTRDAARLPVRIDSFAPELWDWARESPRCFSLRRVLIGVEQAGGKAEGLRGRKLRQFIKGCVEVLYDGQTGSVGLSAIAKRAEDARAALQPPPPPRPAPAPRPTPPAPETVATKRPGLPGAAAFHRALELVRAPNPATFDQWFVGVQFDGLACGVLSLRAQNEFVRDWVKKNFLPTLAEKLREVGEGKVHVEWTVDQHLDVPIAMGAPAALARGAGALVRGPPE